MSRKKTVPAAPEESKKPVISEVSWREAAEPYHQEPKAGWRKVLVEIGKAGEEGISAASIAGALGVGTQSIPITLRRMTGWGMLRRTSGAAPGKKSGQRGRPSGMYSLSQYGKRRYEKMRKEGVSGGSQGGKRGVE